MWISTTPKSVIKEKLKVGDKRGKPNPSLRFNLQRCRLELAVTGVSLKLIAVHERLPVKQPASYSHRHLRPNT